VPLAQDMGIDDESSHPELCSEVADDVTRFLLYPGGVSLFREPDAGNLPVRFDEREQETGSSQTGLRRAMRKHPNSHREAKATAPVLDSTPDFTHDPTLEPPPNPSGPRSTRTDHGASTNSRAESTEAREGKNLLMRQSWRLESRSAQQSLMTARRKSASAASSKVERTTPLVAMP
jgi:hypothetical protein